MWLATTKWDIIRVLNVLLVDLQHAVLPKHPSKKPDRKRQKDTLRQY